MSPESIPRRMRPGIPPDGMKKDNPTMQDAPAPQPSASTWKSVFMACMALSYVARIDPAPDEARDSHRMA
jgi:hypothetical protein